MANLEIEGMIPRVRIKIDLTTVMEMHFLEEQPDK